jgi:CO/xanthine dehydrogenase Mo-binding subunit
MADVASDFAGEVTLARLDDGAVVSRGALPVVVRAGDYPMLRMADTPRALHVHFDVLSGHERHSEIGEPPVGPIGPAIANAIFRATGKRIRSMPFRKHDLR